MRRISVMFLLGVMLVPVGAGAQMAPPPGGGGQPQNNGSAPNKAAKVPPAPTARPLAWPRLDRGAVLCKTEDDLARLAQRRQGQDVGTVDCQVIRAPTPISIVQRKGSAVTQVKTTDPAAGGAGWTDAWLPEKAPTH